MTKNIEGWLLHKQWIGDTSAKITFFTRELGLIHCMAKGVRTAKKSVLLQPFTPLWVGTDERHKRFYTKAIESLGPTLELTGDALFSALYLNEVLYYFLTPVCAESQLFDAYLFSLTQLTLAQDRAAIERLLRRFEWTLLQTAGYAFSLTQEARTKKFIHQDACYQFIPGEGFVAHSQGIPGEHLLALAADNLSDAAYLKSAKWIMRQAIDNLLGGRDIKTRALYTTS